MIGYQVRKTTRSFSVEIRRKSRHASKHVFETNDEAGKVHTEPATKRLATRPGPTNDSLTLAATVFASANCCGKTNE
jgi:hypothetical protein